MGVGAKVGRRWRLQVDDFRFPWEGVGKCRVGVAKAHPDPWVFEEETREQDSNKNEDGVVVAQFFRFPFPALAYRFHRS